MPAAVLMTPLKPWDDSYSTRIENARRAAQTLPGALMEASGLATLTQAIVNEHAASEVVARYSDVTADAFDLPTIAGSPPSPTPRPLQLQLKLPCEGAAGKLIHKVATSTRSTGDAFFLILEVPVANVVSAEDLATLRGEWFERVGVAVRELNEEIRQHRAEALAAVSAIISVRYARHRSLVAAASSIDLPLNQEADAAAVTLVPRGLSLADVERDAAAGGNEAGLADEIASALVAQLRAFGRALERAPRTANKLAEQEEEAIRDVLLFILNAQWGGLAVGEAFIGAGKSDILLRWHDRDAFIGECKFWKGDGYFDEGVEQLLGRYVIWRATRIAMLVFIRDIANVSKVMDKARARIRAHHRYVADTVGEEDSYQVRAQSDEQKIVNLSLIFVIMPKL